MEIITVGDRNQAKKERKQNLNCKLKKGGKKAEHNKEWEKYSIRFKQFFLNIVKKQETNWRKTSTTEISITNE